MVGSFHVKNFTPTPVTLELKIKVVLNILSVLSTACEEQSQPGLTDQLWLLKKHGEYSFELTLNLSDIFSLKSMHKLTTRNELGFYELSFQAIITTKI